MDRVKQLQNDKWLIARSRNGSKLVVGGREVCGWLKCVVGPRGLCTNLFKLLN